MNSDYHPPLALTILSGIFLILGAICFLIVTVDIIWRRGWRSMMGIMVPVYPINAAYMMPVTLYVYFKYGRAAKPMSKAQAYADDSKTGHCSSKQAPTDQDSASPPPCHAPSTKEKDEQLDLPDHPPACHSDLEKATPDDSDAHCHHHDASRPMIITLLVGVSHCGAGCILGDLVGEWLVYGTGAKINGHSIWAELLIDYAFALLFGIAFQYFSIAPMSGEYGPKTVWRAAKADILSLTSFEVGAFGWMIIYQVGIFNYQLSMDTWTYWWMMQIGMALGFATAIPMNYFLITRGIKEPCC
ncbi:hypothetical protein BDY17DRAFT_326841 [Neohortaea acidophila]|uniref:DUF4396 domain-containing protein n=1 Tax=Neohortaea acidophila TaxID=245834 RepID=A0A6A6PIL6_9PEZI|nr:uncharacterized protein BDY17DRAFT_326841 [Neohortaea acidophila]KAF2479832.1 hypothetical protein BDY17DRAFT_326841 [Neohortaea acidophila]